MNKLDFHDFEITVDDENIITVLNKRKEKCDIVFFNPEIKFFGSNFYDVKPGYWVKTTPTKWELGRVNEKNKVEIRLQLKDKHFKLEYSFEKKEFNDITDNYEVVIDGKILNKKISILIPAYGVTEYIDETIEKFIEIEDRFKYLDIEFIIGIDGCMDTFKYMSKKVYPENFTIVLTEKNYGEPIMKNSLIKMCSNEKFIVFDSDDIPTIDMVNKLWEKLEEYEFVLFKSYNFNDGESYKNDNISENYWGGCFAGTKSKFISVNGWYPWRVSSDDEFKRRIQKKDEFNTLMLNEPLFYYRIRNNSSSRDKQTNTDSFLRRCYLDIMTEKIGKNDFKNPNRYYNNKNLILIQ